MRTGTVALIGLAAALLIAGCSGDGEASKTAPQRARAAKQKPIPSPCPDGAAPYRRQAIGAPTVVGCRRKDGAFVGHYTATLADGVVTGEGEFRDGKRHGPWTYRHPSGKPWKQGEYVDGRMHGAWRQYDAEGKLLGEFRLERGTGVEVMWWENGHKRQEIARKDGLAEGKTTWYFETGERMMEADHVAGKLHGSWTFWDLKGQTRKIETWEDGGIVNTVWFENGIPLTQ